MKALTQAYLRERLHYDPETGIFTWRKRAVLPGDTKGARQWNARFAGKQAGWKWTSHRHISCYLKIGIDGKTYYAHCLAWLYMTGEYPPKGIDHDDRNGLNNRWRNLRLANQSENGANRGAPSNNMTGFKGVSFNKQSGRYDAKIMVRGKHKFLGYFDIPEVAHAAYAAAARKYFGEFMGI